MGQDRRPQTSTTPQAKTVENRKSCYQPLNRVRDATSCCLSGFTQDIRLPHNPAAKALYAPHTPPVGRASSPAYRVPAGQKELAGKITPSKAAYH